MCVVAQRGYQRQELDPLSVGMFASAAVMALLGPDDWQICQDAEAAGLELTSALSGAGDVSVAVTVHDKSIDIAVTSGDALESRTLTPRVAFRTTVPCTRKACSVA